MKLNQNCVRDIMLYIESKTRPGMVLSIRDFYYPENNEYKVVKDLNKYDQETIEYTLMKLSETKYIDGNPSFMSNNQLIGYTIKSLTWEGHKFVDTIRDPKIWSGTKKVLSHLESTSITLLSTVATKVLEDYISKNTGFKF